MENIKAMFKTHIYVFIKQNFYGPISDKNFSAAISITPSACSRDTVGKPLRNSSNDASSKWSNKVFTVTLVPLKKVHPQPGLYYFDIFV